MVLQGKRYGIFMPYDRAIRWTAHKSDPLGAGLTGSGATNSCAQLYKDLIGLTVRAFTVGRSIQRSGAYLQWVIPEKPVLRMGSS